MSYNGIVSGTLEDHVHADDSVQNITVDYIKKIIMKNVKALASVKHPV